MDTYHAIHSTIGIGYHLSASPYADRAGRVLGRHAAALAVPGQMCEHFDLKHSSVFVLYTKILVSFLHAHIHPNLKP